MPGVWAAIHFGELIWVHVSGRRSDMSSIRYIEKITLRDSRLKLKLVLVWLVSSVTTLLTRKLAIASSFCSGYCVPGEE